MRYAHSLMLYAILSVHGRWKPKILAVSAKVPDLIGDCALRPGLYCRMRLRGLQTEKGKTAVRDG